MFTNFFIIFVGVRPFREYSWERVSDRSDRSDESEKDDEKQHIFVNRILNFSCSWLARNRAQVVAIEKNAAEKRPYNKAVSSHPYCVSRRNKETEKYNKETDGREWRKFSGNTLKMIGKREKSSDMCLVSVERANNLRENLCVTHR
ncbi:hypothetical protein [Alloprevotella rava]|uniref:Uncharacterized protein n=1 Tax=Alloprevotella rava TaxID=671218 RepID=A0A7W5UM74_9BACT|nr:hypothetical protein [Alloprevotella rava]MBB3702257.1 hypothetical protein [Alloprevotella rava]